MFPLIRTGLAMAVCLVSSHIFAQDRMCYDRIPKKITTDGAGNGVYDFSLKWTNGSTIKVLFSGGTEYVRSKVRQYSKMWEQYANVTFQYIESGTPDIRITFQQGAGSWSYLGIHSRQMAVQGQATMNYGWFNQNTDETEFRRTILHEFGHALGLMHEHKNPLSNIKWNLPAVYNHYQAQGWTISEINEQVINKYNVSLSNRNYDPNSIMHYPVSATLTTDGYSVPWNTNLSSADIALIKEMYPKSGTPTAPTGGGTGTSSTQAYAKVNNVEIEHNAYQNNVKGLKIITSFSVNNMLGKKGRVVAYFYTEDGTTLKDKNQRYNTTAGGVSSGADFTPRYEGADFNKFEIFIPYDELELPDGEHRLKFALSVWSDQTKELFKSGSYSFTYSHGISTGKIDVLYTYENENSRMAIMPKFTISNAKDLNCKACVYYYYANGTPILTPEGKYVARCQLFMPEYANTIYNNGYLSDLYMYMPYDDINIPSGTHDLKFFVALFNNDKQFAKSGWYDAQFTR